MATPPSMQEIENYIAVCTFKEADLFDQIIPFA